MALPKPAAVILDSWDMLNSFILKLDEGQTQELLDHELKHQKRPTFSLRLHSRLNKLRAHRERDEIREVCGAEAC